MIKKWMGDLYIYLHTEKQKFMQFICGNLLLIVTILAFILLGYGSKYFFYAAQFDTIDMLQNYEWVLKWWISIGRFSLVAMKAIFENGFLNINFSTNHEGLSQPIMKIRGAGSTTVLASCLDL